MGRIIATLGVAIALLAGSLGAYVLAGAATRSVDVQDDTFVDGASGNSTSTIAVGDTVQWNWSGSNQHTVDNNGGTESFSSGALQTSGSFSHTFNTAGTYNYICGVHGTAMQGTIVVQAAQAPTSTAAPQSTNTVLPEASNTPTANATATPGSAATAPAPSPTASAGSSASPTVGAPAASTSVPGSGGALPSAGHGETGAARGSDTLIVAMMVGAAGMLLLGGLVLARRVVR